MPQIKGRRLVLPIIQGGMGIGVSLGNLAGSVAACGAMGVISSANTGFRESDFWTNSLDANMRTLRAEIAKAKRISDGRGLVAVNIMVATSQYPQAVKASVEAGADAIICGAGLPLDLPGLAGEADILLAPIVSSGKAARTICRMWDRRFARVPDFVVIEGSEAGGHLGFNKEELLGGKAQRLAQILADVKNELQEFELKYNCRIPVFVAGGVYTGADVAEYIRLGAEGAQVATRFIATYECDASQGYKEIMLAARPEDVRIVQSPVGMPGRALYSPLFAKLAEQGRIAPNRCVSCITTCNPAETPYCISRALIEAVQGNWQEGLFFCGSNVGRVEKMMNVDELLAELCREWRKMR
jgi:NAD(P)H-dependent flavin oxidoreductase YrpB (nitropropane dioxygenase family)